MSLSFIATTLLKTSSFGLPFKFLYLVSLTNFSAKSILANLSSKSFFCCVVGFFILLNSDIALDDIALATFLACSGSNEAPILVYISDAPLTATLPPPDSPNVDNAA